MGFMDTIKDAQLAREARQMKAAEDARKALHLDELVKARQQQESAASMEALKNQGRQEAMQSILSKMQQAQGGMAYEAVQQSYSPPAYSPNASSANVTNEEVQMLQELGLPLRQDSVDYLRKQMSTNTNADQIPNDGLAAQYKGMK